MKKSLRFAALIGMIAFLSWLPAIQQAEAQQPPAAPMSFDLNSCANPAPSLAAIGTFPAPYCGDRCETEGEGRGCREIYSGGTRRTPCTCRNGVWACGPF